MSNEKTNLLNLNRDGLTQFFQDMGDREEYNAQDVLNWLGY